MIRVTKSLLPDRKLFDHYIDEILASGWLTNNGVMVQRLEEALKSYLGVEHVVLVANGTLALQIAYRLLDVRDEVITTPFSFVATASSIDWHGAKVRFGDIDPNTMNLDPETIPALFNANTSALVPVHVYGNPCDNRSLQKIARDHKLALIYDASHAFGVVDGNGDSILTWGDISTLSFHATKLFHTIEGGALIFRDAAMAEKARKLINFGFDGGEIQASGINAKMNEIQAAVGLCLLDVIDSSIERRGELARLYDDKLSGSVRRPLWQAGCSNNYAYYPVFFDDEMTLLRVQQALVANAIEPRRYFHPSLDSLPYFERRGDSISQSLSKTVLCLPLYADLGEKDVTQIARIVKASVEQS